MMLRLIKRAFFVVAHRVRPLLQAEMNTPIILVAIANDRSAFGGYLRELAEEWREIRDALARAESVGRCELIDLPFATAGEVFAEFRREKHRGRIAVFHFAGHADSADLLLERTSGAPVAVGGTGLAAFLAGHSGLQLVFLNACATHGHVRELLAAGVSAVISTSRAIHDEVAREFAACFYRELGEGASLRRAFDQAAHAVRTMRPGPDHRHLYAASPTDDRPPWELSVREGAERVELWTLGTPPLPPLSRRDLPENPFRHLQRFTGEHAELFFGREHEIWELHGNVTAEETAPVILLYGPSGVGKSSLLEAGLLPRLEEKWEVRHAQRRDGSGLLGALAHALGTEQEFGAKGIVTAWGEIEERSGLPLLVVLDQLEEAFTRGTNGAGEMAVLAFVLGELFRDRDRRPSGKVVLGFRKEWLADVEGALGEARVPRRAQFVSRLSHEGVVSAIAGITRVPRLREHYGLEVEDGLEERIALDLVRDEESHIAPLLQILLAGMWDVAVARSRSRPRFDSALYESLTLYRAGYDQKLLLDEFLGQQLAALEQEGDPSASGLALDYLAFHTTSLGTAQERTASESAREYAHTPERASALRRWGQELYLLADALPNDAALTEPGGSAATRLAHDTLAPLVRRRFDESDAPGQRARRILESRAADWARGTTGTVLGEADLSLVERGAEGMRAWTDDEQRLMEASRRERDAERRHRKRGRITREVLTVVVVLAAVLFGVLYRQSESRLARSESTELTLRALSLDESRRDVALLLAVAAFDRSESFEAHRALFSLLGSNPYLQAIAPHPGQGAVLTPDGGSLAGFSVPGSFQDRANFQDATILLTRLGEEPIRTVATGRFRVQWNIDLAPRLSAEGTRFLGVTAEDPARNTVEVAVWDVQTGARAGIFQIRRDQYSALELAHATPASTNFAAVAESGAVILLDASTGRVVRRLVGHRGKVVRLVFSHDGTVLGAITGTPPDFSDPSITAWRTATGAVVLSSPLNIQPGRSVVMTPHSELLATGGPTGIRLWQFGTSGAREVVVGHRWAGRSAISGFTADSRFLISPDREGYILDGRALLFPNIGGEIALLDVETGANVGIIQGPANAGFTTAAPRRNRIATQAPDGLVYVWDLDGNSFVNRDRIPVGRGAKLAALSAGLGRAAFRDSASLVVWDVREGHPAGPPIPMVGPPHVGAVHLDREAQSVGIVSFRAGNRMAFTVHDVATGDQTEDHLLPEGASVFSIQLSSDGRTVAGGWVDSVWVSSLPRGRGEAVQTEVLPGWSGGENPLQVAFSPDGALLAWRNSQNSIGIQGRAGRDGGGESLTGLAPQADVNHLLFSGNGQVVAAVQSNEIRFWRRGASRQPFQVARLLPVRQVPMTTFALNHSGTLLASSGGEGVVLLDVERGEVLGVFQNLDTYGVVALTFTEEENHLVISYADGSTERIAVTPEAWADHACALAANSQARERWAETAPPFAKFPRRCAVRLKATGSLR